MLLLKILHLFKDLWAVRCYFNFELVLLSSECEVKLLILYLSLYSFHSEKKKSLWMRNPLYSLVFWLVFLFSYLQL